jgi:cyclophilin family peptidyl-prolyl cis-trans isomerase
MARLALGVTLAAAGCNSKDVDTPTASIAGRSYDQAAGSSAPVRPAINLHPTVQFRTSIGSFIVKLDAERAPLTVDNFISYVNAGQYNGTIFHQVYDGFIVLGGGYDAEFNQRPTQSAVRNEAHNGLTNRRGTIAMARQADAIDSAASQFFINLADNATLNHTGDSAEQYGYCVFGEVLDGMDVIERIGKGQVRSTAQFENVPVQPIVIEMAQVVK